MVPINPTNLPSSKRFLTNSNSNQPSNTPSPPPESSLSSDSSSEHIARKTRELPNLSDCHGCRHRINYSNPNERLQLLDSMWRIVLLCRKCIKKVKCSDLCPYCFSATDESECFSCRDCKRCIHRDCVGKYSGIVPSLYRCSGLGYSVCVDCWIPESLANCNSIRVYKRKNMKKKKKKKVELSSEMFRDSSVLGGGSSGTRTPEDVANDANCVMERKVADAVRAKEIAQTKALMAKSAVELANGALNLVAGKKDKGKSVCVEDKNVLNKAVSDADLAFMLHRAMNSSPRISRSSSGLAVPGVVYARGSASTRPRFEVYCNNSSLREKIGRTGSETSVCSDDNECQGHVEEKCNAKADRYLFKYRRIDKDVSKPSSLCRFSAFGSCTDLASSNVGAVSDRACMNGNEWQGSGEERLNEKCDRYLYKYTRCFRNANDCSGNEDGNASEKHEDLMLKNSRSCVNGNDCQGNGEGNNNEYPCYLLKYTRTRRKDNGCLGNGEERSRVKPDRYSLKYTRNTLHSTTCKGNGESYKRKPDRYLLKYRRTCVNSNQCQQNEKPDRYLIKYVKRSTNSRPVSSC